MGTIARSTLNTGDIPTAAEWNTQFDTIYSEFNGNISDVNLASNAVTGPKIATGAVSADKLGLISIAIPFSYSASIGSTANSIRQIRIPYNGTLTKINAKSETTPGPQNLTINVRAGANTLLNASALSMTGTTLVEKTGADLVNTTLAVDSILHLDIKTYGTATGGGVPLTVNVFMDVAGTEL
jgi:hypothetical protein